MAKSYEQIEQVKTIKNNIEDNIEITEDLYSKMRFMDIESNLPKNTSNNSCCFLLKE